MQQHRLPWLWLPAITLLRANLASSELSSSVALSGSSSPMGSLSSCRDQAGSCGESVRNTSGGGCKGGGGRARIKCAGASWRWHTRPWWGGLPRLNAQWHFLQQKPPISRWVHALRQLGCAHAFPRLSHCEAMPGPTSPTSAPIIFMAVETSVPIFFIAVSTSVPIFFVAVSTSVPIFSVAVSTTVCRLPSLSPHCVPTKTAMARNRAA